MKTRHFQHNRPVFTKVRFRSHGKWYEKGEDYPWEVLKVEIPTVESLYLQGFIHHNEELEQKSKGKIGDGLDELSLNELHMVVDDINSIVESKARNKTEIRQKKITKSPNSISKQIGLIRRWRMTYGDME